MRREWGAAEGGVRREWGGRNDRERGVNSE